MPAVVNQPSKHQAQVANPRFALLLFLLYELGSDVNRLLLRDIITPKPASVVTPHNVALLLTPACHPHDDPAPFSSAQ